MSPLTLRSAALVCLLAAGLLPAQRDLAGVFPADSWAFTECAGLDSAASTFQAAKIVGIAKQVLGADGWNVLQSAAQEKGGRDLDEARGVFDRVGIRQQDVRRLLGGAFAIGVGRPTMMGQIVLPSIALVAALGSGDAAKDAVAAFESVLTEKLPWSLDRSDRQVGGVQCAALALPGRAGHILHVLHDGLWFVSNSEGYLRECLAAARGQAPSLAKNASLSHGRGQLPGTRVAGVFVNLQQFGQVVTPFLPYEVEGISRALGITAAPDLFVGFAHDGKGAHDVFELTLPGPSNGLCKALFNKPVTNRAAQWVKPTTSLFMSLSLDGLDARQALERVFAALPEGLSQEIRRNLQRSLQHNAEPLEILSQTLAAIGPEISIAVDTPQPSPPFVTFAVFVEVRDQARAEQLVRALLAHSGHGEAAQFEESDGVKMWTVDATVQNMRMSPTLALRDGWIVGSNFKNVVKRTLRATSLGAESLAADARFQAAAKVADGAALFVTGRLQPLLNNFWGAATMGVKAGTSMLGFEPADLPDSDAMGAALDDVVVVGRANEHGFTLRVQQPLGFGAMVPAAGAALDWFLGTKSTAKKIY